jgi:UDP-N-acetylglucosamine--N-acetylmuramyl-(pentapeptide) pyrophosphoryl-undecaprenol N-acetylglucosamine transferase
VQGRVLILAGGGGHTGYGYALAQALHGRILLSFLVPEGDSLSAKRLSKFGEVSFLVKPRGPKTPLPIFMTRLAKALIGSIEHPFHGYDVVVSTGSNFCVLPAIMAWMRGASVVSIESPVRFTKLSKTVHALTPFSHVIALWWEEQRQLVNGLVVGPILPKPVVKPWDGGYILVTGGMHGHKILFDTIAKTKLQNVVLQTGKVNPIQYSQKHPEWKVMPITERFHEILAGAQVVVTHFGFTVLEAAVYKKPVVVVVNPEWTRTVGVKDARYLARKMNAVLVSEITTETLLDAIDQAKNRAVPALRNGAENLAEIILRLSRT